MLLLNMFDSLLEREVYEKLRAALQQFDFNVGRFHQEDYHHRGEQGSFFPDLAIYSKNELVALVEIKGKQFLESHPNYSALLQSYKDRLSAELKNKLFVVSDGVSFILEDNRSRGALMNIEMFVAYLTKHLSLAYKRVRDCGEVFSFIEKQIRESGLNQVDWMDWFYSLDEFSCFEENSFSYRFADEEFENQFFLNLLGRVDSLELCRYSTLDSLFRLLKNAKQNMCSIVCMNDKGELNYVNTRVAPSYSSIPEDPNNCFILSLLPVRPNNVLPDKPHEDELTFWRLYGDDASGVCLTYSVNPGINTDKYPAFKLARVSYEREDGSHPELSFVNALMSSNTINGKALSFRNWHIWKHFFKNRHFAIEDEVRLLYMPQKGSKPEIEWIKNDSNKIVSKMCLFTLKPRKNTRIKFPLTLVSALIGPKITEPEVVEQYEYMRGANLKKMRSIGPSKLTDIYR